MPTKAKNGKKTVVTTVVNTKPRGRSRQPRRKRNRRPTARSRKAMANNTARQSAYGVARKSLISTGANLAGTVAAKKLALALCLPGCCPNLRIKADAAESQPTSATNLHRYTSVIQPSVKGTYAANLPTGKSYVALFRDPLRSYILFTPNPTSATYTYTANFHTLTNTITSTLSFAGTTSDQIDLDPVYLSATSAFRPHGDYLFCGLVDGRAYIWVDYLATVTITRSATTGAADESIQIRRWEGDDLLLPALPFVGTAATITFTNTYVKGGYYHFAFQSDAATPPANNISLTLSGDTDVFGHNSVPNALPHLAQFTRARINAASIMTTPTAAVINRGGTITAASLEGSLMWYNALTTDFLTSVPSVNCAERDFTLGTYAFLKPGGVSELTYQPYTVMSGAVPASVGYNLKTDFRYVAIVLVSDVVGATSPGLEYLLSLNWDIEYQTSDLWLETHLTGSTYLQTIAAIEIMSHVSQFHDNPLHFGDIMTAIRGGYSWVRRNANSLGTWANTALDLGVPIARKAADFMINLPEW